jgi:hypothetical protein
MYGIKRKPLYYSMKTTGLLDPLIILKLFPERGIMFLGPGGTIKLK